MIGIGDETVTLGLFRAVAGKSKMTPIARSGHIAMMVDERIPTKNYGDAELYLVEAMTTAGLSGSPIYARETITIPMHAENRNESQWMFGLGGFYLLGLVHGFMPIKTAEEIAGADPKQSWHSGICMVVPSQKILEILDQPGLLNYEDEIVKNARKPDNGETPVESGIVEPHQTTRAPERKDRIGIPIPTRKQFEDDLAKAIRKRKD